ncbi:MAG: aromatic ring-hydroxylating dioxygenase subunit alpha [Alteromonadales bacterium]|nr:aromatic ring-hydroxylating dioxygenase subunit alpha [Alteromonadales bacterium]MCP4987054.1 aromatic ring-hydroxylating dioxygenase subunit alpha [Colwellia sp.]
MNNIKLLENITDQLLSFIKTNSTAQAESIMTRNTKTYTDPEYFKIEKESWFKQPQLMCFTQDIPKPGSFVALEQWPIPVLIVRDSSGIVHAFLNSCPHRNGKLKSGKGKCSVISCPYHAWNFDLNGNLIKVFEEHTFGDIDKKQHGLTHLVCEERYGMIFVVLDTDITTLDIDEHLGDIAPELKRWELENLTLVASKEMNIDCNWKLAIETFSEGYHFEPLHRDSVGDYAIGNCSQFEVFGNEKQHHRIAFPNKSIKELITKPKSEWGNEQVLFKNFQLVHFIFPNNILLISPTEVEFFQIIPGDNVGQHTTIYSSYVRNPDLLSNDKQIEAANAHFEFIAKVVIDEDYDMVATIQKTLNATKGERVANYGKNEPALHNLYRNFHGLLLNN